MNQGKMVFSQVMEFASDDIFKRCVEKYDGNYKTKDFTCWKQFLSISFGQLTHRQSLSDTALCLRLHQDKLYHLGIGKPFNKSTIARANESRRWEIYRDFALKLIDQAKMLCSEENQLDLKLKGRILALDATIVDLCLSVFWWARFRSTKAAIKLHTLLDLKTSIPEYILITEGSVHEVNVLDSIVLESGSYLVMDKAFVDFKRLSTLTRNHVTFVTRAKDNLQCKVTYRKSSDKRSGVIYDQDIELTGTKSFERYPEPLRRIKYFDEETGNTFIFLTNNFKLSAATVCSLYRYRWGIEIFFKWIKQHLKILSFWGQSENAVKTQIWIAISTYVLVIIAKKRLKLSQSLYEIIQMISLSAFDRTPLNQLFAEEKYQEIKERYCNQLKLF